MKMNDFGNIPSWLERARALSKSRYLEDFTMDMLDLEVKDILMDSCFYLSAGADITPIVAFKDIIYSYILCDKYLYDSMVGIENKFNGILVKLKDRLFQNGFTEIQKFNIDKYFLGLRDRHWSNGVIATMKNCEISFWSKEDSIYSIIYINHDNTYTYTDLYVRNNIMPKAICEILPDGGSLISVEEDKANPSTLKVEEKKNILPEYVLGHLYSIGDIAQYDKLPDKVEYFGDYGPAFGTSSAMQIHKRNKQKATNR